MEPGKKYFYSICSAGALVNWKVRIFSTAFAAMILLNVFWHATNLASYWIFIRTFSDLGCVCQGNRAVCQDNLELLCPVQYRIVNVVGSRSRDNFKKCTWVAVYVKADGQSIPGPESRAAIAAIKLASPRHAKSGNSGRAEYDDVEGVFINWFHQPCPCDSFFDVTGLRNYTERSE